MSPDDALAIADQACNTLRLGGMWGDDCRQEARLAAVRHADRTPAHVYMRARWAAIDHLRQLTHHRAPSTVISLDGFDEPYDAPCRRPQPDDHIGADLSELTDRERVVIQMLAVGRFMHEIGDALGVSESSVSLIRSHARRTLERTGAVA